jgi:hypothetical protein
LKEIDGDWMLGSVDVKVKVEVEGEIRGCFEAEMRRVSVYWGIGS